jgi:hypothetical protein
MDKPVKPGIGKSSHRAALQTLSYPEKVRVIVELQKIAAPILKARGKAPHVWTIFPAR